MTSGRLRSARSRPSWFALAHDALVDDRHEGLTFDAWYQLALTPYDPKAECLTLGSVESARPSRLWVIHAILRVRR